MIRAFKVTALRFSLLRPIKYNKIRTEAFKMLRVGVRRFKIDHNNRLRACVPALPIKRLKFKITAAALRFSFAPITPYTIHFNIK